jgi:hypothetical protein
MSRVLKLRTPLSRSQRASTAKARIEYANKSDRFQSKADKDKDAWPWQFQYAGYAGLAAAVPGSLLTAVTEKPRFREFLEGDLAGNQPGFDAGKKLVMAWREYWTTEDGEIKGFHNENWKEAAMRRRRQEDMEKESAVKIKVVYGAEQEKEVTVNILDLAKPVEEVEGDVRRVEILDSLSAAGDQEEDAASAATTTTTTATEPTLQSLTQTASSWTNFNTPPGVKVEKSAPETQKSRQKKLNAMALEDLDSKIAHVQATIKDPYNTQDIDSLWETLDRLKAERRKLRGFLGGWL